MSKAAPKDTKSLLGQAKRAQGGVLRKIESRYGPYAEMKCSACGALGCLIPVPHGKELARSAA